MYSLLLRQQNAKYYLCTNINTYPRHVSVQVHYLQGEQNISLKSIANDKLPLAKVLQSEVLPEDAKPVAKHVAELIFIYN